MWTFFTFRVSKFEDIEAAAEYNSQHRFSTCLLKVSLSSYDYALVCPATFSVQW